MKKEHWLYLVIAILAIWIIASYMSESKEDVDSDEKAVAGEESNLKDIGMPVPGAEGEGVVETVVEAGAPAGENKGVIVSATIPSKALINVVDQKPGIMVSIGSVDMPADGWVVVHEDRNGTPGNILGAQRFDAGSYAGGQIELLRTTLIGGQYYVMLHADDGDKLFDHKLDLPLAPTAGIVTATFFAK
jgi:hypothetical protein